MALRLVALRPSTGFSAFLLSTTFLAGMTVWTADPARADCQPDPITANGQTVDCTGTDADGFNTGVFTNIVVNVLDAASIEPAAGNALSTAGSNNTVQMSGSGSIGTVGANAYGIFMSDAHGTITLNDTASITTTGNSGAGVYVNGGGGIVTLNNASSISTEGAGTTGVFLYGDNHAITLNNNATIETLNARGIYIYGVNGTISLNGAAGIGTAGLLGHGARIVGNDSEILLGGTSKISTAGDSADGANIVGDNGIITLNDDAAIDTSGQYANGAEIYGNGGTITLNNNAKIDTAEYKSYGAYIDGNNGAITLNGAAAITTTGDFAYGALIDGTDGTITLTGTSTISTDGENAKGAYVLGNNATISLNDDSTIDTTGDDGNGTQIFGDDGKITLSDNAAINTTNNHSLGASIIGDGGTITLSDNAAISTAGDSASGVFIRGDAGTVTLNIGTTVAATGIANAVQFENGSNELINFGTLNSAGAEAILGADTGDDTIENSGTVTGGSGIAMDLRGGDDLLTLKTGSVLNGLSDGGAGFDVLTLDGVGAEDDIFQNFETLQVLVPTDWSLSGDSTFLNQIAIGGTLRIDGTLTSPQTQVFAPGVLGGTGTLESAVTSLGTISPGDADAVGTLTVDGDFVQTGGLFDIEFGQTGMDRLNVTGTATIAGAPEINLTALGGATGFNGTFLHADGGITGTFGAVNYAGNGAATLVETANDDSLNDGVTPANPTAVGVIAVDGTPVVAGNFALLQSGLDYLDMVTDTQLDQVTTCLDDACAVEGGRRLWARGFGHFGHEDVQDGNQAYDYHTAGTALGGELEVATGLSLGGSLGYAHTYAKLSHDAARTESDGEYMALYATYETGPFFVTGIASGALQQIDLSRKVATATGKDTARAETDSWQAGGGLQTGFKLDFGDGWRLTPSAGIAYQHLDVDGYREHGAGLGNVTIGEQDSDAVRLNAQLNLAKTLAVSEDLTLTPHLRLGLAEQINFGGDVNGSFSTDTDFTLAQRNDDRVMGLAGAGIDFTFDNGVTANLDYIAQVSGDHNDNALLAGIGFKW